jgi:hypothetical protein
LGGSQLEASTGKSSQDPVSTNKKLGVLVHACHPSYPGRLGGSWSSLAWAKTVRPYLKKKNLKQRELGRCSSNKALA